MAEQHNHQPPDRSRRQFLKYSGAAISGAVIGGVIGGAIAGGFKKKAPAPAPTPTTPGGQAAAVADYNQATMYFTQSQLQITQAAVERIFPKDDLGPGAAELGVAYYIDHQLASPWGINGREYRTGPYVKGEATQGDYQSIHRTEVFNLGLIAIQDASMKKYNNKFPDLADDQKDAILTLLEKGDIEVINGITGTSFFNLLRTLTLEGVYADPLYGGNKNMQGWKMRKYPGNQMSYTNIMEKAEFVTMEPMSLRDHIAH
ncbi:gluconate 2-dehydrogenase subunit 3 family protein [Paenibacillus guangzhouensis]|uniref:gluconate 2-dehydrogenase subunit 3 family protein n=1 Tax=Paenibacillus guangzhouensis TaxID=1473112 RepID=UPI0012668BA3|nr:gluconate 2-dehydrogenase subunit 3 family protein [Paenibacillus guangzhouensis]